MYLACFFINKNINPVIMKSYVYDLHANTCLYKKFGTVLININCPLNLNAFYGLIKISK
jgi:hypothetical protein